MCEIVSHPEIGEDISDAHGVICLSAQMAFEENHLTAAAVALECLANSSPDIWQVLTALRCLIRLKLSSTQDEQDSNSNGTSSIDHLILTAYNKLLQLLDIKEEKKAQIYNEANWFMKIAWNLALQCEFEPGRMKELFSLSYKLLSLCPSDNSIVTRQRTCMLMAAAAGLQVARTTIDEGEKKYCLEESLHHVATCRKLSTQLYSGSLLNAGESDGKDTIDILLLLYEFEARVKLNDPQAEHILEQALRMPSPDPKMFETLAGLAVEPPAQNKSISVRALKLAIRKHLQGSEPDFKKCSKLFHSLVLMALSGNPESGCKEEALNYYYEIINIVDKRAQGQYPDMELLWLMTKAWNCGINFYSCGHCDEAERWCSTGMKFLKYLDDSTKSNYEEHMNTTYSEVLAKMERTISKRKLEEE